MTQEHCVITATTQSEEETFAWAREFAGSLRRGDVLALHGNLGTGKTVVSRGIARGLGFLGGVHSPSYALVHEYPNEPPIFHLDLYRLGPHADLHEIGVEHYAFSEGITLIEWPERLERLDVGVHYEVRITRIDDTTRKIEVIDKRDREGAVISP